MADPEPFESAFQKLERANQHIADLTVVCDAFTGKRHNLGFYREGHELIVEVRLNEPVPTVLPLLIGDAVHNLRTVLDHATWELIGLDGGKQNRNLAFPTGRCKRDFESLCRGIETPCGDTIKFFIAFEAYPGGNGERLYGLKLLDNFDKHQVLTPVANGAILPGSKIVYEDGSVSTILQNCKFYMGSSDRTRITKIGLGESFEFEEETDPTVEIFFGDVEFFKSALLVPTLTHLSETVSDALKQFRKFVVGRTP